MRWLFVNSDGLRIVGHDDRLVKTTRLTKQFEIIVDLEWLLIFAHEGAIHFCVREDMIEGDIARLASK